jgi:2-methylcitrate dehydratase
LAFSHNALAGRLIALSERQIANATAMAAVSDASFAGVRAKPLSQWKGLASAQSALGAMNTLFLARGVEGPLGVVEGPMGIDHLLGMQIDIDWEQARVRWRAGEHDQEIQRRHPLAVRRMPFTRWRASRSET